MHNGNGGGNELKGDGVFGPLAALIGVVGFIAGIAMGEIYKMVSVEKSFLGSEYDRVVEGFNYPLMFGAWIGTAILVAIFLGIGVVINNQHKLAYNQRKLTKSIEDLKQSDFKQGE